MCLQIKRIQFTWTPQFHISIKLIKNVDDILVEANFSCSGREFSICDISEKKHSLWRKKFANKVYRRTWFIRKTSRPENMIIISLWNKSQLVVVSCFSWRGKIKSNTQKRFDWNLPRWIVEEIGSEMREQANSHANCHSFAHQCLLPLDTWMPLNNMLIAKAKINRTASSISLFSKQTHDTHVLFLWNVRFY